jgi:methionyl-tRNA synthetase
MLAPIMPERAQEMWRQLGLAGNLDRSWDELVWGGLNPGTVTAPADALFPRIDVPVEAQAPSG